MCDNIGGDHVAKPYYNYNNETDAMDVCVGKFSYCAIIMLDALFSDHP